MLTYRFGSNEPNLYVRFSYCKTRWCKITYDKPNCECLKKAVCITALGWKANVFNDWQSLLLRGRKRQRFIWVGSAGSHTRRCSCLIQINLCAIYFTGNVVDSSSAVFSTWQYFYCLGLSFSLYIYIYLYVSTYMYTCIYVNVCAVTLVNALCYCGVRKIAKYMCHDVDGKLHLCRNWRAMRHSKTRDTTTYTTDDTPAYLYHAHFITRLLFFACRTPSDTTCLYTVVSCVFRMKELESLHGGWSTQTLSRGRHHGGEPHPWTQRPTRKNVAVSRKRQVHLI